MCPGSSPESTTCTLILASDVLVGFPNQDSKIWDLPPHPKPVAEEAPFLSLVSEPREVDREAPGRPDRPELAGLLLPQPAAFISTWGAPGTRTHM